MNHRMARSIAMLAGAAACILLAGCAPEVGSDRWCEMLDGKPKGDWTVNEASAYAKHCVLGMKPEG